MFTNMKNLLIKCFIVFLMLVCGEGWITSKTTLATTKPKITYNIELDEEKWKSVKINITIENNRFPNLLCVLPNYIPGILKSYDFSDNINQLSAIGGGDQQPEVKKLNRKSWLIDNKNNNLIIISYTIHNSNDPLFGECIDQNFAWINSSSMFLFIREYSDIPIDVNVIVPVGWKLATGLTQKTEIFNYRALNYQQLIFHPLFMGPFEDSYFTLNEQTHFVIAHGTYPYSMGKLGVAARKILQYQSTFFGIELNEPFYFIFRMFPIKRKISSQQFDNLSMILCSNASLQDQFPIIEKTIATNLFTKWFNEKLFFDCYYQLPHAFQPRTSLIWFPWGISEYYGSLTMIRTEFWNEQEFINYYIQRYNDLLKDIEYSEIPLTSLSYNISESDYFNVENYIKLKSELICLLIDLKIMEQTINEKSLDDLVIFLKNWFIDQGKHLDHDALIVLMKSLVFADFGNFFDLYIYGNIELPFIETVEQAGIFLRTKTDTLPVLDDYLLINKDNRVSRLRKNSQMSNAGLKIGDRLKSINDIKIYGQLQLRELIESLKIGSTAEIMIERKGMNLMLVPQVAGRKIKQVELKEIKNFTPHSNSLKIDRIKWLYDK